MKLKGSQWLEFYENHSPKKDYNTINYSEYFRNELCLKEIC